MCGIAGCIQPAGHIDADTLISSSAAMAKSLFHRGPDSAGQWTDPAAGIALAFRRLAILDLSDAGHQPMQSTCGRYVLVFNGEIYNHLVLRQEVVNDDGDHQAFRGHSDTETLMAAIVHWGVELAIMKAAGMFAFALWDRANRTLTLGRDRVGEKPLYYGWAGKSFVFASELKAFKRHPEFDGSIDRDALALHFRFKYIPAPHSIYLGVRKLLPGSLLHFTQSDLSSKSMPEPRPYWSAQHAALEGIAQPFKGSLVEAKGHLMTLLESTVREQMLSDVPLGAFLSGGVDSSAIVALMQAQSRQPVKTFTIGFTEEGYNEAPHASSVARHLGTDHAELYVSPEQAMEVIPTLPCRYDEPFGDSSQIPSVLIAQLARQHVTVSLTGDGGDEVFGGYNRYLSGLAVWHRAQHLPSPLRSSLAKGLSMVPPEWWNRVFAVIAHLSPNRFHLRDPAGKAGKLAHVLAAENAAPDRYYRALVSDWHDPEAVVLGANEPRTMLSDRDVWKEFDDVRQTMMYLDTVSFLPGDILTKVDRAAMSVSLETRAPYLDHRIVEFAWRLPMEMKIANGQGKWILRRMLYDHVPKQLIERPKTGFGLPLEDWLRHSLRGWANDLLNETRIRQQGYLNATLIDRTWQEHLAGTHNRQHQLWSALMFQAWLDAE